MTRVTGTSCDRYFVPPAGTSAAQLATMQFVATKLPRVVQFNGTAERPLRHVQLLNVTVAHTAYTYMEPYAPIPCPRPLRACSSMHYVCGAAGAHERARSSRSTRSRMPWQPEWRSGGGGRPRPRPRPTRQPESP